MISYARSSRASPTTSRLLEIVRKQLVARQQLVEVRAVAFRQARGLADIARRDLEDLRQVIAREFVARFVERGQPRRTSPERLLHQFGGDDGAVGKGDGLAHDVI